MLLTDLAAASVRATYDVDAIAQVFSRAEYYRIAEKLKGKGFREDSEGGFSFAVTELLQILTTIAVDGGTKLGIIPVVPFYR